MSPLEFENFLTKLESLVTHNVTQLSDEEKERVNTHARCQPVADGCGTDQ